MATFSFFFGYIAALASGMTEKDAVNQALKDSDWAMGYYDSLNTNGQTTFGSWVDAQI